MSQMEFWGLEVKSGQSLKVEPGQGMVLHLSQACLGELQKNKGNEFIHFYAKKDGQKFLLGNLSTEKFPHLNLDLVFEDDFELSHDWKHGSVHFAGYKAANPSEMSDEEEDSDDDLREPVPVDALDNGKPETKLAKPAGALKSDKSEAKPKVTIVEPNKDAKKDEEDEESDEDEDEDSDEDEDEEGSDDDQEMANAEDDSEDEDDESDEEGEKSDEETPKKAQLTNKRPAESASKTPISDKKAKVATPQQKTGGKKAGEHVATPHPSKKAGKTPAENSKQQTPKSAGAFSCSSCPRSFGSEQALQSHTKAKHAGK